MPEISRILGIVIAIFHDDLPPPHFHAGYGKHHVKIGIETGDVLAGSLPRLALAHVQEWREMHQDALLAKWDRAVAQQPPGRIEPLE